MNTHKDKKSSEVPGVYHKTGTQLEFEFMNTPFGKNVQMEIETADEYHERSAK